MSNGEGIGVALFVQGCNFHCHNCFNPETWDFASGKEWTMKVREEFLHLINRPYIKRVSILGGEPLAEENLSSIFDLVDQIRLSNPQKYIWLYTGYTWEEILDEDYNFLEMHDTLRQAIVAQCDVVVDGQYIDSQRDITLTHRGSSNQRLIDVQKTLQKGEIVLWTD